MAFAATHARDLTATIAWARQVAVDPRTIFLDTETTGLDERAEIVEIAIVDCNGRVLLDTLVKPVEPIPADATRIHGISNRMVATAPGWDRIAPQVNRLLARAGRVVIYNADFDTRIMRQCNARYRLPDPQADWHCAMRHYAAYAGIIHQRYGGYRWHKLGDAAARFGHTGQLQHRALSDTLLCRLVVLGMAGMG